MLEKIRALIAEYTEIDDVQISEDSVLLTDLGLNSFELVELLCALEDAYGLEFPDKEIRGFKTVGDVMQYMQAHT